jgi:PAS domain S-box-containing protein
VDYENVLSNAPLPILIYQDQRIVYCNKAGFDLFRYSGYDFDLDHLSQMDPWSFIVPEERDEARTQMRAMFRTDESLRNVPRTAVDAQGHRVEMLMSATRIEWKGKPAVELSYTILGLYSIQHPEPQPHPAAQGATSSRDARKSTLEPLTPRERAVAMLIAQGKTTADIIETMNIKESTLRSYIKAIYRKTGTHSRTELTRMIMGHR